MVSRKHCFLYWRPLGLPAWQMKNRPAWLTECHTYSINHLSIFPHWQSVTIHMLPTPDVAQSIHSAPVCLHMWLWLQERIGAECSCALLCRPLLRAAATKELAGADFTVSADFPSMYVVHLRAILMTNSPSRSWTSRRVLTSDTPPTLSYLTTIQIIMTLKASTGGQNTSQTSSRYKVQVNAQAIHLQNSGSSDVLLL